MMMKTAMWRPTSANTTEKKVEFGPVQKGWYSSPQRALAAWVEPVVIKDSLTADQPKRRGRPPKTAYPLHSTIMD